jgi:hypothetical protein
MKTKEFIKLTLLTVFAVLAISCQEKKIEFLTDCFTKNQEVNYMLDSIDFPDDSLWHPRSIFSYQDYILLSEEKIEKLVALYNTKTKVFERFLNKGQGPGEFIDVNQIGLYNDSAFFVNSTFGTRLHTYLFESAHTKPLDTLSRDMYVTTKYFGDSIAIDGKYAQQTRFRLHDVRQAKDYDFGEPLIFEGYPEEQEIMTRLLAGTCTFAPTLNRMACASCEGDFFEIYDYSDFDNIRRICCHAGVLPILRSVYQNQPVIAMETKVGIHSLTSTPKYIYLVYNENLYTAYTTQGIDALYCKKILVFDWDGKPVKILNLNHPVIDISYNAKYNVIYCLGYDANLDTKIFSIDVGKVEN